jgi:hypothetical protein
MASVVRVKISISLDVPSQTQQESLPFLSLLAQELQLYLDERLEDEGPQFFEVVSPESVVEDFGYHLIAQQGTSQTTSVASTVG